MSIDINLLKQLRDTTFAPMKDCKEALVETNGDLDAAIEFLKKKGAAQVAKKADRETNEGAIKTLVKGTTVYAVKVACETDFTSGNDLFKALTNDLLTAVSAHSSDISSIDELPSDIKATCDSLIGEFVGKIGENTKLADVYIHTAPHSYVYTHPGDKIVAVVQYTPLNDKGEIAAKQVALQIAAMNPEYLSVDAVDATYKNNLQAEFAAEVAASGKPADIIEKIVAGKLDKAFAENVLLEQSAIRDDGKKVKDAIQGQADIIGLLESL